MAIFTITVVWRHAEGQADLLFDNADTAYDVYGRLKQCRLSGDDCDVKDDFAGALSVPGSMIGPILLRDAARMNEGNNELTLGKLVAQEEFKRSVLTKHPDLARPSLIVPPGGANGLVG